MNARDLFSKPKITLLSYQDIFVNIFSLLPTQIVNKLSSKAILYIFGFKICCADIYVNRRVISIFEKCEMQ